MYIKPTDRARGNIFDVHEDTMDLLLYPVNDEVPCPWDADISVSDGKVTIVGSLGPSGPRGAICSCQCFTADFTKYYKLEVPDDQPGLITVLADAGWVEA